jgi:hypothetical protein
LAKKYPNNSDLNYKDDQYSQNKEHREKQYGQSASDLRALLLCLFLFACLFSLSKTFLRMMVFSFYHFYLQVIKVDGSTPSFSSETQNSFIRLFAFDKN